MSKRMIKARVLYSSTEHEWLALHWCQGGGHWREWLTSWHNAFWAADHHMRYDCGRREPSSGDMTFTVRKQVEYRLMSDEEYADALADAQVAREAMSPEQMAEWTRLFEEGMRNPMYTVLNEGGRREDPTASDHLTAGDIYRDRCEYDEGPTVELGTVDSELGPVVPGMPGIKSGIDGAAWWERLWGHGRQR
jgi:hypothetical protein